MADWWGSSKWPGGDAAVRIIIQETNDTFSYYNRQNYIQPWQHSQRLSGSTKSGSALPNSHINNISPLWLIMLKINHSSVINPRVNTQFALKLISHHRLNCMI